VQVDKGPVEKDGITIQSYQRLPTQLLQQWTDKQKRPKMQFRTVSPGGAGLHRLEVVLPDAKNSSKDLHYCPAESFAAAAQAKEFAALLALMDLQPTLPLERKLPEPYRCVNKMLFAYTTTDSALSATGETMLIYYYICLYVSEHVYVFMHYACVHVCVYMGTIYVCSMPAFREHKTCEL
jgi:hypothetical protein